MWRQLFVSCRWMELISYLQSYQRCFPLLCHPELTAGAMWEKSAFFTTFCSSLRSLLSMIRWIWWIRKWIMWWMMSCSQKFSVARSSLAHCCSNVREISFSLLVFFKFTSVFLMSFTSTLLSHNEFFFLTLFTFLFFSFALFRLVIFIQYSIFLEADERVEEVAHFCSQVHQHSHNEDCCLRGWPSWGWVNAPARFCEASYSSPNWCLWSWE